MTTRTISRKVSRTSYAVVNSARITRRENHLPYKEVVQILSAASNDDQWFLNIGLMISVCYLLANQARVRETEFLNDLKLWETEIKLYDLDSFTPQMAVTLVRAIFQGNPKEQAGATHYLFLLLQRAESSFKDADYLFSALLKSWPTEDARDGRYEELLRQLFHNLWTIGGVFLLEAVVDPRVRQFRQQKFVYANPLSWTFQEPMTTGECVLGYDSHQGPVPAAYKLYMLAEKNLRARELLKHIHLLFLITGDALVPLRSYYGLRIRFWHCPTSCTEAFNRWDQELFPNLLSKEEEREELTNLAERANANWEAMLFTSWSLWQEIIHQPERALNTERKEGYTFRVDAPLSPSIMPSEGTLRVESYAESRFVITHRMPWLDDTVVEFTRQMRPFDFGEACDSKGNYGTIDYCALRVIGVHSPSISMLTYVAWLRLLHAVHCPSSPIYPPTQRTEVRRFVQRICCDGVWFDEGVTLRTLLSGHQRSPAKTALMQLSFGRLFPGKTALKAHAHFIPITSRSDREHYERLRRQPIATITMSQALEGLCKKLEEIA